MYVVECNYKVIGVSFCNIGKLLHTCLVDVGSNRKMLKMLITKNTEHNVDTAENGLEALDTILADPEKYDVVFMDNFMPIMVIDITEY